MSFTHRITSIENIKGRGLQTRSVYIEEDMADMSGLSVEERFQAAYEEYIKSMGYITLEEARDKKGVHFATRFDEIPDEIMSKHGIAYRSVEEHFADAIYGFDLKEDTISA